jgi:DNA-binding NtrC family response regulator
VVLLPFGIVISSDVSQIGGGQMTDAKRLVAILNTSSDTIALLQDVLDDEGIATVADYVPEFREGRKDVSAFLRQHKPQAVIFDVAIPYDQNWRFFKEQVVGPGILPVSAIVVTTTNKAVLERLVGPTDAIEMVGKPFDLDEIVQAVRRAIERNTGEKTG